MRKLHCPVSVHHWWFHGETLSLFLDVDKESQHPPPFPRWFAGGLPILTHSQFASARPFGAAKEGIEVVDADVNSQDLAASG